MKIFKLIENYVNENALYVTINSFRDDQFLVALGFNYQRIGQEFNEVSNRNPFQLFIIGNELIPLIKEFRTDELSCQGSAKFSIVRCDKDNNLFLKKEKVTDHVGFNYIFSIPELISLTNRYPLFHYRTLHTKTSCRIKNKFILHFCAAKRRVNNDIVLENLFPNIKIERNEVLILDLNESGCWSNKIMAVVDQDKAIIDLAISNEGLKAAFLVECENSVETVVIDLE